MGHQEGGDGGRRQRQHACRHPGEDDVRLAEVDAGVAS